MTTSSEMTTFVRNSSDQVWILTDGSVTRRGLGATLYVTRQDRLLLAGFFSSKLRKHQVTWLPREVEALSIAAAVKHFSPFIIQSKHRACLLTDSQPCVQALQKLFRGEFSASPRVTSFLTTVSLTVVKKLASSISLALLIYPRTLPVAMLLTSLNRTAKFALSCTNQSLQLYVASPLKKSLTTPSAYPSPADLLVSVFKMSAPIYDASVLT